VGRTTLRVHYETPAGSTADASIVVSVNVIGAPGLGPIVLGQDVPIPYEVISANTFDAARLEIRNQDHALVFKQTGLPVSTGLHEQDAVWLGVKWNQSPNTGKFANPNNGPYDVNIIGVKDGTETIITRSSDIRLVIEADVTDARAPGQRSGKTAGLANALDTLQVVMARGSDETLVTEPNISLIGASDDPTQPKHLTVDVDDFNTLANGAYNVIFRGLRDDIGNVADSDKTAVGIQPYSFTVDLR
jgi:hypothetical protein